MDKFINRWGRKIYKQNIIYLYRNINILYINPSDRKVEERRQLGIRLMLLRKVITIHPQFSYTQAQISSACKIVYSPSGQKRRIQDSNLSLMTLTLYMRFLVEWREGSKLQMLLIKEQLTYHISFRCVDSDSIFSYNFYIYLFIYFWLCSTSIAVLGLSLDAVREGYSQCGVWASHCGGFSC